MFDAYRKWLGIPPKDQPPNHYRLLGVEAFEEDLDVIEGAADRQMAFVRQYQSGEHAAQAAKILNEIASARLCLLKPASKSAYDAKLRQQLAPADSESLPDLTFGADESPPKRQAGKRKKKSATPSSGIPKSAIMGISAVAVLVIAVILFSIRPKPANPNPITPAPQPSPQIADADKNSSIPSSSKETSVPNSPMPRSQSDEKFLFADSKLMTEPAGEPIDLLKLVDLKRDVATGDWQLTDNALVSPSDARIYLPAKLPEDYQLKIVARPLDAVDLLTVGFMMSGRQGYIYLDSWNGAHSGALIDQQEPSHAGNSTWYRGRLFKEQSTSTVVLTVHPRHLHVTFDGVKIIDWRGDPERFHSVPMIGMASRESPQIQVARCKYVIQSATFIPIKQEIPEAPLTRFDRDIDLMPLFDFDRDADRGVWAIQKEALNSPEADGRLVLPVRIPQEYTLSMKVELPVNNRGEPTLIIGVPWNGSCGQLVLRNDDCLGIETIGGRDYQHSPTRRSATYLKPGIPSKLDITATKEALRVEIDGRTLIDWRGDPRNITNTGYWMPSDDRRMYIASRTRFKFRDLKIGPPAPSERKMEHARLETGKPFDLMPLIDPDRDRLGGSWEKTDQGLRVTGGRLSCLTIPCEVPREYKLSMRLARESGAGDKNELLVSLPFGGTDAQVFVDASAGTISGLRTDFLAQLDYGHLFKGTVIPPGAPTELEFWVRQSNIKVMRGSQTIVEWNGAPGRMAYSWDCTVPAGRLAIGSLDQRFRFEKLTIEPLDPAPVAPPSQLGADGLVLPTVNVIRDAQIGEWKVDGDVLTSPAITCARLNLPVAVPEKYVLSAKVKRISGSMQLWFGLVVGGRPCSVAFEEFNQRLGVELVDGKRSFDSMNLTLRQYSPPLISTTEFVEVRCLVLADTIIVTCGNKEVIRWHGDPRRLSQMWETLPPNGTGADRRSLWLGSWESSFAFRDIELTAVNDNDVTAIEAGFAGVFPTKSQVDLPFANAPPQLQRKNAR